MGKIIETVQAWLSTAAATNKPSSSQALSNSSDTKILFFCPQNLTGALDSCRLTDVRGESSLTPNPVAVKRHVANSPDCQSLSQLARGVSLASLVSSLHRRLKNAQARRRLPSRPSLRRHWLQHKKQLELMVCKPRTRTELCRL